MLSDKLTIIANFQIETDTNEQSQVCSGVETQKNLNIEQELDDISEQNQSKLVCFDGDIYGKENDLGVENIITTSSFANVKKINDDFSFDFDLSKMSIGIRTRSTPDHSCIDKSISGKILFLRLPG